MKYKVDDINKCTKKISFEIGEDRIKQAYDSYFKDIQPKAVVPGFRKGKAPRNVLENHFRSEAKENMVRTVVADACQEAITKSSIKPFGMPTIGDIAFQGNSLTFQATIEVRPSFEVKKYKEIKVKKEPIKVEDKEVDETVDRLRVAYATYKVVEGRSVNVGDMVIADSKCEIDGKVIDDKKDESIELNEQYLLPDYIKNIVGAARGDTKTFEVTLPETLPQKQYRGKKGRFTLVIKDIKEKVLPEMDAQFLKMIGNYEKIEDVRAAIRKDIEKQKEDAENARIERELMDKLCKENTFDVPRSLLDEREEKLMEDVKQSLKRRGVADEEIASESAKLEKECKAEAFRQVKAAFILDKIAALENVSVTEEDVSGRFYELSRQYRQSVDAIREYYDKNDLMDSLKAELRNDKTMDIIKNAAVYA